MIGYKYGVWLVYDQNIFNTEHISHFTVQCFMNKYDAFKLYDKINNNYGNKYQIKVKKEGSIFNKHFYKHDKNNLQAWGYYGLINNWDSIQKLAEDFSGDFSHKPHTSIHYSNNKDSLTPKNLSCDLDIIGTLKVVNINGLNPLKWSLLN